MRDNFRLALVFSNTHPLRSLGTNAPNLQLICDQEAPLSATKPSPKDGERSFDTVNVLKSLLRAEALFLARLRDAAADRCKIANDLESIQRELNNENVIHVARFFFLLKSLDCSTPGAVQIFLERHNAAIASMIENKEFHLRGEKELRKAAFSDQQMFTCVKTVRDKQRAVFAKTEIASLLFDHMGRDSAVRTLDLLIRAGLLTEEDSDPLTGTNRKLIRTDGALEDAIDRYLSDVEQFISAPQ